jgi:hypothetical protein
MSYNNYPLYLCECYSSPKFPFLMLLYALVLVNIYTDLKWCSPLLKTLSPFSFLFEILDIFLSFIADSSCDVCLLHVYQQRSADIFRKQLVRVNQTLK